MTAEPTYCTHCGLRLIPVASVGPRRFDAYTGAEEKGEAHGYLVCPKFTMRRRFKADHSRFFWGEASQTWIEASG